MLCPGGGCEGFWRAAGEMLTLLEEHPQLQVSPLSSAVMMWGTL